MRYAARRTIQCTIDRLPTSTELRLTLRETSRTPVRRSGTRFLRSGPGKQE